MDFSDALKALKAGKKVRRTSDNYLKLIYIGTDGNYHELYLTGMDIPYHVTDEDLKAEDWVTIEEIPKVHPITETYVICPHCGMKCGGYTEGEKFYSCGKCLKDFEVAPEPPTETKFRIDGCSVTGFQEIPQTRLFSSGQMISIVLLENVNDCGQRVIKHVWDTEAVPYIKWDIESEVPVIDPSGCGKTKDHTFEFEFPDGTICTFEGCMEAYHCEDGLIKFDIAIPLRFP